MFVMAENNKTNKKLNNNRAKFEFTPFDQILFLNNMIQFI